MPICEPTSPFLVEKYLRSVFVAAGVAAVLVALASFFVWNAFIETDLRVHQTHEVIVQAHASLLVATRLQSSSRGFALTKHERFWKNYELESAELIPSLLKLKQAQERGIGNVADRERLEELRKLSDEIRSRGDDIVKAAKAGVGMTSSEWMSGFEAGQAALQRFSTLVADLEKDHGVLLAEYTASRSRLAGILFMVLCLTNVLLCVALVWSFFVVSGDFVLRRQAETSFGELLAHVPDATLVIDAGGTIRVASDAVLSVLGYRPAELVGSAVEKLVPIPVREAHVGLRTRYLAAPVRRSMASGVSLRACHKDGHEFPAEISLSPLSDRTMVIATVRDVTERCALEAELRRSNQDLEHFAYGASHDLQEPLRTITTYLSVLEKSLGDKIEPATQEALGFARESAKRMRDQISALLQYSRVGHGQVEKQVVDTELVLQRVLADLKPLIDLNEGIVESVGLPTLSVDPFLFEQLLSNLVANSLKYRGEQAPRVVITAKQQDGEWVFSVSDNGVGIPEEAREKVFEPFRRLHSRAIPGTGVGLATCRRILDRLGGKIWVESNEVGGATFRFSFAG